MTLNKKIKIHYDKQHDMLLVTIGEPQDSYTDQASGGGRLHIRRNVYNTREVTGFVITAFVEGFLREHPDFKKHFETVFGS